MTLYYRLNRVLLSQLGSEKPAYGPADRESVTLPIYRSLPSHIKPYAAPNEKLELFWLYISYMASRLLLKPVAPAPNGGVLSIIAL
jgi:hypothetical protein